MDFRTLIDQLDEYADQVKGSEKARKTGGNPHPFQGRLVGEDDDPNNDPDTGELMVGDYQTRHFDMCPGATALYKKIDHDELAVRTAKLQDVLFYMEKDPDRKHVPEDAVMAQVVADQIMMMAEMMGMEDEHDYIQGHVDVIKDKVEEE